MLDLIQTIRTRATPWISSSLCSREIHEAKRLTLFCVWSIFIKEINRVWLNRVCMTYYRWVVIQCPSLALWFWKAEAASASFNLWSCFGTNTRSWFRGIRKHGADVYLCFVPPVSDQNVTHVLSFSFSSLGHVSQRLDSFSICQCSWM
jgi:hypothetical protein